MSKFSYQIILDELYKSLKQAKISERTFKALDDVLGLRHPEKEYAVVEWMLKSANSNYPLRKIYR